MAAAEDVALKISLKDEISSGLSNITGALGKIALAFAAFEVGKNVITGVIRDSAALQSQMIDLGAAVKRAGYSWEGTQGQIDEFTKRLQDQKGVIDDYSRVSLQRAIDYTKDLASAESLVESAADLAAAKHMDLTTATDLLGKAFIGHTETLARYGLTVQKGATNLETFKNLQAEIDSRFGGASAAAAEKITTKFELLKDALQGINEAAGRFIGADQKGGGLLGNALTNLASAANWFAEKIDEAGKGWDLFLASIGSPFSQDAMLRLNKALVESYGNVENLDKQFRMFASHKSAEELDKLASASKSYNEAVGREGERQLQVWMDKVEEVREVTRSLRKEIPIAAEQIDEMFGDVTMSTITTTALIESSWRQAFRRAADEMVEFRNVSQAVANAFATAFRGATRGAVNYIVGQWKWLQEESKNIWEAMAKDFSQYFVEEILKYVAAKAVAGIVKLLGSIFDTPANDAMAARQGRDYATYFAQGVAQKAQSTNWAQMLSSGNANFGRMIAGYSLSPGSGPGYHPATFYESEGARAQRMSGGITIVINGSMTSDFIQRNIVDVIQRASFGRFNNIKIKDTFSTGRTVLALS